MANVPSPVVVGEGLILLSGGYNAGSMMLHLVQEGDKINAQPVFRLKADVSSTRRFFMMAIFMMFGLIGNWFVSI